MILKFRSRKGSVVTMLMGTVAMVGIVSAAAMNLIGGPITTAAKVTHQNMAQNDLLMNAKVVVMNASTRLNMGDEDSDGYIEPVPFVPTSASSCGLTLPGEGGCLPSDIGAILTDPWGTQYAYCVWDHGDVTGSANRIVGEDSTSGAVLAIISAGPNKRFETPCSAYDGDPATNDIAINPDGLGDDLVQIYTYAGAVAGSGGLWELKDNEPETAVIDKKLEIGDVSAGTGFAFDTTTGTGEFPYVKTDFLASKTGGTRPVTMVNNIALDGNWLSGDGSNQGIQIGQDGAVRVGLGHLISSNSNGAMVFNSGPDGIHSNVGFWFRANSVVGEYKLPYKDLMRITAAGNVGIGTTNPQANLHVHTMSAEPQENISATKQGSWSIIANKTYSDSHSSHYIGYRSRGTISSPQYTRNGDLLASFEGRSVGVAGPNTGPSMHASASEDHSASAMGGYLHFRTTPNGTKVAVERVRITSEGNVGIGTTNPTAKIHVVNGHITLDSSVGGTNGGNTHLNFITDRVDDSGLADSSPNKAWAFYARGSNYTGSGSNQQNDFGLGFYNGSGWLNRLFVEHDTGNIGIGSITPTQKLQVSGNVLANQYLHPSDVRLKTNISPIKGFEIISGLRGVSFNWKGNGNASAGVLAQDVEVVMPQAVITAPDGMKSVEYDQLIAPLIEAVKELEARIRHLEADNDNLCGEINEMTKEAH